MAESWHKYYQEHKGVAASNILLHWYYLAGILFNFPKKVLEIGCGPADHSVFLSSITPGLKISVLDYDRKIVAWLKKTYSKQFENFYVCDITDDQMVKKLGFKSQEFDVIYSQGLLEHFNRKGSQKIVNYFLPYAKKIIFSIPSETYPNRDYGNELLRNEKELEDIFRTIPDISFKIRKYFPDIGLRTKMMTIKKRKLNFLRALYFVLFDSCHYFIEVKKSS